ncbi:DUF4179 domain-containing protein [Lysinibacillus piscis]|uniref:DUF4179 domain-containing protein n=1 Tax=Lysinibacillus piscis TaxID=2518931 RepID=A0ABQ5NNS7_9BACI|nr:DUF4179 domain-containing protein [Lysinibacillus sp. KH24]GLC90046.1 hypothetical protein LYSBPC_31730 [Lysinibacillus sp. KH24]
MKLVDPEKYTDLLDAISVDQLHSDAQLLAYQRLKKQKLRQKRFIQLTLAAAFLLLVMIGSIRLSPAIAQAVAQIPGLKPLVELIAYDKGMKDIVYNEYFEPMNESQTRNGKTLTITGVVADESGMMISYKLHSNEDLANFKSILPEVKHNGKLIQAAVTSNWPAYDEGTYEVENKIDVVAIQGMDYSSKDFELQLTLHEEPETLFAIPFTLQKDIQSSKHYPINKQLIVDGQRFTVHELIISPLRSELKMSIDSSNSKKILNFGDIRIYDEQQEEWGKIRNGIVGFGQYEDTQFSIMLESNYFRTPKNMTIEFHNIEAINKEDAFVMIDFDKKQVIHQPTTIQLDLEIKDHFEIQYKMAPYHKKEHTLAFNHLIDAEGTLYYANLSSISEEENFLLMWQAFDIDTNQKPPVSPVKLEIARYGQYLQGVGRMQVDLQ